MHAETGSPVSIRFALPSAKLSPFVTTYYFTQVLASPSRLIVEDRLNPEWANLRFVEEGSSQSSIGNQTFGDVPMFAVTGPTACAPRFRMKSGRSWGIGLLPLGWAALCNASASDYADTVVDGMVDPVFASLRPLATALSESSGDFVEDLKIVEQHMDALALRDTNEMKAIRRVNSALIDSKIATVTELAEQAVMNVRSLERLCKRAFGFSPKLLLRRQRFLRSLSQFMLDPSLKWLNTLDQQYHDQAHFVRDFRYFMGMSPSAYAKLDKPILIAAAQARMAIAGQAVQALHDPNAE